MKTDNTREGVQSGPSEAVLKAAGNHSRMERAYAVVRRDVYEGTADWTLKEVCATREEADAEVARLTAINGPIYEVHVARMRGFTTEERLVWMDDEGNVASGVRGINAKARRLVGPWERVANGSA